MRNVSHHHECSSLNLLLVPDHSMTFCSLQVLKYSDNLFRWSWILERWQRIQIDKNQTKIPTLSDNLYSCSCLSGKTTAGSPRASFGASFFSSPPSPPPLCPIRSLLKRQSCHTIRLMYATILNWPHSDSLLQYFKTVYQVGFQMRTALMAAVFRWTPPPPDIKHVKNCQNQQLTIRKGLRLAPCARQEFTTGQMTNLIALDTQKLVEVGIDSGDHYVCWWWWWWWGLWQIRIFRLKWSKVMPHICVLSSAPFQILLAFYFLYQMVSI